MDPQLETQPNSNGLLSTDSQNPPTDSQVSGSTPQPSTTVPSQTEPQTARPEEGTSTPTVQPNPVPNQPETKALEAVENGSIAVEKKGTKPTKLVESVVEKLELSFQRGLSVSAACVAAGIDRGTYYYNCNNDQGFFNRMTKAKEWGSQLAGDIVVDVLLDSTRIRDYKHPVTGETVKAHPKYADKVRVDTAKWWLEKKQPEEFGRGLQPVGEGGTVNNNQTNYYFLTDGEFRTKVIDRGIKDLSPQDIASALENEDLGRRDPEMAAVALPKETLRDTNPST
jgi:hypothetical protein